MSYQSIISTQRSIFNKQACISFLWYRILWHFCSGMRTNQNFETRKYLFGLSVFKFSPPFLLLVFLLFALAVDPLLGLLPVYEFTRKHHRDEKYHGLAFSSPEAALILVSTEHQESRPLARSNDIPVLNGFVNTIDWDQNQSDLSDLTLSKWREVRESRTSGVGPGQRVGRGWARGRNSWCWRKGARPLGTRIHGLAKCSWGKFRACRHFRLNWPSHSDLGIKGKIFTWAQVMPNLVKGDDVKSGTKANTRHGRLRGGTGVNG